MINVRPLASGCAVLPLVAAILLVGAAAGPVGEWAESALAAERLSSQDPDPPGGTMGWLHVEHPAGGVPYLADAAGSGVTLRGVVAAGLVDYWSGTNRSDLTPPPHWPIDPAAYAYGRCPANDVTIWIPPLCESDLVQMHQLNIQLLRLAISWSLLEPEPGRYSSQYLDRIAQVVDWATQEHIYVLIDMHQNGWSRYIGQSDPWHLPLPGGAAVTLNDHDGAPAWATFTDGLPSEKFMGQREVNPAVFEAATNFWLNRSGIQDHYIRAVARLAARFKADRTVIGYSLFNEPWPGWTVSPLFEDALLFPFYRRLIDALTGAQDGIPCPAGVPYLPVCGYPDLGIHAIHQLYFVESGLAREITDFPTHLSMPLTSYPNVVLGLHAYTHIYTPDRVLFGADPRTSTWPSFDQSYWWGELEARQLGAALFVSEYGNDPGDDGHLLTAQVAEQKRHHLGATFWVWKQNCGTDPWGLYDGVVAGAPCAYDQQTPSAGLKPQNGPLRTRRAGLALGP
jgi:endoglycosylceramidase